MSEFLDANQYDAGLRFAANDYLDTDFTDFTVFNSIATANQQKTKSNPCNLCNPCQKEIRLIRPISV